MTHTHFDRGKRIRIALKDGTVLVRRFVERHRRTIEVVNPETGDHEQIATGLLRNVSIYKGPTSQP